MVPELKLTPGQLASVNLVLAGQGGKPRWPTQVELGVVGRTMVFQFKCWDDDIWATMEQRDEPLWDEEVVEVFLAPGPATPARYFEFEVNPLGAMWDGIIDNPDELRSTMKTNAEWNCPGLEWSAWRDEQQGLWGAEMRIPLLEIGGPSSQWRLNMYRIEQPRGDRAEFSAWSPILKDKVDFHTPSRFGLVTMQS